MRASTAFEMEIAKKPSLDIKNPKEVVFSRHALDRFRERYGNNTSILREAAVRLGMEGDPERFRDYFMRDHSVLEAAARVLLKESTEDELPRYKRLLRLLNNRCNEARYFRFNKELRFVIDANKDSRGCFVVLTIERPLAR